MKIKKRGIQIPVRIIINALIILFEIALLVVSAVKFSEKFLGIYWLFQLISIITVIYIINMRGNQSYKIMWIIFILLVPPVGTIFYLLWGGGRMFPHLKKHMKKCTEKFIVFGAGPSLKKHINLVKEKYDLNDYNKGYAGNNKSIDAVEVYYNTPSNIRPYKKAKYKVNNFAWQYDNEKTNGQDGYAGQFGTNINRFQIEIK